jgi:hypothetical protein
MNAWVLRGLARALGGAGETGDEVPALFSGHHDAFAAQDLEAVPDGHGRDSILPGQLALGGQRRSRA